MGNVEITVCMGSSCFARGNDANLAFIEEYIKDNNLDIKVELAGSRCEGRCEAGPNVVINNKIYNNVTVEVLKDILDSLRGE